MSSSSLAWNSVAIPFSARLRASFEEAYTILGCRLVSQERQEDCSDTYLDTSIIWRPRNKGNLASANLISSEYHSHFRYELPRTLTTGQIIVEVVDSVSWALANLSLVHVSITTWNIGAWRRTILFLDSAFSSFSRKKSQSPFSLVSSITISL